MLSVVQRVKQSSVRINQEVVGKIGKGLLVLLGVAKGDSIKDCQYLANKIVNLRIFEDQDGKMNRSLLEVGGEMLVVSQFTLLGDCRKGRRPSFIKAAEPDQATELYEHFVKIAGDQGISVKTGQFRAMMEVALINDGPVTLILESN